MTRLKVHALLYVAILVMALCPMLGALYFVDRVLVTSLNLGFNEEVADTLDSSAERLKRLGQLDPENRSQYRSEFERVESLKVVYGSGDAIKQSLRHSLLIYFGIGVFVAVLAAVAVAAVLSSKITKSYRGAFDELARSRERVRYLEEISSWQELAKMLAHEIKNPLTPIEVLVTALPKAHDRLTSVEFAEQLLRTEGMVLEELAQLKNVVARFSGFARLPTVQLEKMEVHLLLDRCAQALTLMFSSTDIELCQSNAEPQWAMVDVTLFKQVLVNIVRNGVEANPQRRICFTLRVESQNDDVMIHISNDGALPPIDLAGRMFDPYISGHANKENMGLGLTIVRKILLEHGGDISYAEADGHPEFAITLRRAK